MDMPWYNQLAILLAGGFFGWMLYRFIAAKPESLSKESLSKSFGTMGFLALGLIGFIAVVVMLLKG